MNTTFAEEYVKYVSEMIARFKQIGELVIDDEISPQLLNRALSDYYNVSMALNAEYQRVKVTRVQLELQFETWHDTAFEAAKLEVLDEYKANKSIKPAIKEFEVRLRSSNRKEFDEYQIQLKEYDIKERFLIRLMTTLEKYDRILTTIAQNMRTEMTTLSITNRAEKRDQGRTTRTPVT